MTGHDRFEDIPAPRQPASIQFGGVAGAADRILTRIHELRHLSGEVMSTPIVGPSGQNMTVDEAHARATMLDHMIEMEQVRGNLRHRRVRQFTRIVTLVTVAVVDLPIMLWLASSVFNVDWAAPLGLPLVISFVVSVLATGGSAAALHHLGHNQRQYKNERRQLEWSRLSTGGRMSLVAAGLLVTLMGVVMFVRMYTEGVLSGLSDLAVLLAVLVAVVMIISAALVFWTAFRDGSLEQDDLLHYSAAVRPYLRLRRDYENQACQLSWQYDSLRRRMQDRTEIEVATD
jgi:hypothetical protein